MFLFYYRMAKLFYPTLLSNGHPGSIKLIKVIRTDLQGSMVNWMHWAVARINTKTSARKHNLWNSKVQTLNTIDKEIVANHLFLYQRRYHKICKKQLVEVVTWVRKIKAILLELKALTSLKLTGRIQLVLARSHISLELYLNNRRPRCCLLGKQGQAIEILSQELHNKNQLFLAKTLWIQTTCQEQLL